MAEELKRDGSAAVSHDDSGYTAYINQRKTMQQKQSSDQLMMLEINNLKTQVAELSQQIQDLRRLINNV